MDVTKPNEPYWEHVDAVVQLAWEKGIRVAMIPAWSSYVHGSSTVNLHADSKCELELS